MTTGSTDDMTSRLRRALPPWFGSDDENPVLSSLLGGMGWAMAFTYGRYLFAQLQTRLATSTGGWLELSGNDFFGTSLPRLDGEGDPAYSRRLRLEVLRDRQTRNAIDRAVYDLIGQHPKIFEAWNPLDCGGIGTPAFSLGRSGLLGSLNSPYEVFIEFPYPQNYGIPLRVGIGDGPAGLGHVFSFVDPTEITGKGATVEDVFLALERVRPAGVTYYVHFTELGQPQDGPVVEQSTVHRIAATAGTAKISFDAGAQNSIQAAAGVAAISIGASGAAAPNIIQAAGTASISLGGAGAGSTGGTGLQSLAPSSTWTGAADSGTPAAPADPTRVHAKPAMQWHTPSYQRLTSNTVIGVDADAKGGISHVTFYCEGNSVTVTTPSLYTDTDANGNSRTRWGYWVTLDVAAAVALHPTGTLNIYAEAVANDLSMERRVIGGGLAAGGATGAGKYPLQLYPRGTGIAWSKHINPAGGADFLDLASALSALTTAAPESAEIIFDATGTYILPMYANVFYTGHTGYVVFRTNSPGVTATLTTTTTFNGHADVSNGWAQIYVWQPSVSRIEFRGSGIVLDMRNWMALYNVNQYNHWLNGCVITNSEGARDSLYWNKQPHPGLKMMSGNSGAPSPNYLSDVTIEHVIGINVAAGGFLSGCKQTDGFGNHDSAHFIVNYYEEGTSPAYFTAGVNALNVKYNGAGTATMVFSSPSPAGKTLDCRVNGVSVGAPFPIPFGFNGTGQPDNDTYYDMGAIASAISAIAGGAWVATSLDTTRAGIALCNDGNVNSSPWTITSAGTTFQTAFSYHTEWWHAIAGGGAGSYENVIIRDNVVRQSFWDTSILNFEASITEINDVIVKGNVWESSQASFPNGGVHGAHVVFNNNYYDDPFQCIDASNYDGYCEFRQNIFGDCNLYSGTWLTNAYIDNAYTGATAPGGGLAGNTGNFSIANIAADAVVNKTNGDFRPAGTVLATLKSKLDPYDTLYTARSASDAVGPFSKNETSAPTWPFGNPAYVPAGWSELITWDFKTSGVISVNEAQSAAGRAADKGHWALGTLSYRDYAKMGLAGYGFDVFVDPFSGATPQDYLIQSPLGEVEVVQGVGLKLKTRPPLTTSLQTALNSFAASWSATGIHGAPGNGVPVWASAHIASYSTFEIEPPFARTTWARLDDPRKNSFAAAAWSLIAPDATGKQVEIDDMESFDNTGTNHTLHWTNDTPPPNDYSGDGTDNVAWPFNYWEATHEYTVVCDTDNSIKWYVDGVLAKTIANVYAEPQFDAGIFQQKMLHIADQSAGFPWGGTNNAQPATGPCTMIIEKVKYWAPPSNANKLVPGAAPAEVQVNWRAGYTGLSAPESIAVGTVLADLVSPDGLTTFKLWEPSGRIAVSGSTLVVAAEWDYASVPVYNFVVGAVAADGTPSYGRTYTFNVTQATKPNWWVADALYDLDFAYNRYHGGPTTLSDVIAGVNNTVLRDTYGLVTVSDQIKAAGVLLSQLQGAQGCVLVVFTGFQPSTDGSTNSEILSPNGANYSLMNVCGNGGPGATGTANDGLGTDFHSVALGSGATTGRVNACVAWDATVKRLAGNGGAGTESGAQLPATYAGADVFIGRSKNGDQVLGTPGAKGRIARIVVWDASAGIPTLATVVSRASLNL